MNLDVKIKRTHVDALIPLQANPGDGPWYFWVWSKWYKIV